MTKEQALEELAQCLEMDEEGGHSWGDHILCEFLKAQGHSDLVEAWEKIDKWYS